MGKYIPIDEKLARKIEYDLNGGCWLWSGNLTPNGYGQMSTFGGRKLSAHVESYVIHKGHIPAGMFVLHSCDVRSCVNPAHLSIGTRADNMRDMARKGRATGGGGQELSTEEIAIIAATTDLTKARVSAMIKRPIETVRWHRKRLAALQPGGGES